MKQETYIKAKELNYFIYNSTEDKYVVEAAISNIKHTIRDYPQSLKFLSAFADQLLVTMDKDIEQFKQEFEAL